MTILCCIILSYKFSLFIAVTAGLMIFHIPLSLNIPALADTWLYKNFRFNWSKFLALVVVNKENLDKVKEKLGQKWRWPKLCYFLKWIISWSLSHGVWMSGLAAIHTWTARWDCKCCICAARLIIRELSAICLQFRGKPGKGSKN